MRCLENLFNNSRKNGLTFDKVKRAVEKYFELYPFGKSPYTNKTTDYYCVDLLAAYASNWFVAHYKYLMPHNVYDFRAIFIEEYREKFGEYYTFKF